MSHPRVAVLLFAVLLTVVMAQEAFAAGSDLFEVDTIAEGAESSTRLWARRAFIVLGLLLGFLAIRYEHVGVGMMAMGFIFLGAFLGRGVDAITDGVGLAEGATIEHVVPMVPPDPIDQFRQEG